MARRVLVLGGGGFLGRRTVRALGAALPGATVDVGGRGGPVRVDLRDEASLAALDGYDVVVDCADTVAAAPDAAVRRVVARGGVFVESTAETATNLRLLDAAWEGPGAVVVGAGLFPGLTNLMATDAARHLGPGGCDALDVGVRFSPLAGCGPGTVRMMVDLMGRDALHVVAGRRSAGPPVAAGPRLPFRAGPRRTLRVGFSEPPLLHRSTGVANVGAFMAPVPALAWPVAVAAGWLPRWVLANPVSRWLNVLGLRLLRTVLLRWRAVDVELLARARGPGGEALRRVHVRDGFDATAHAIAALVAKVVEGPALAPGARTPDQVQTFDDALERMTRQGCAVTAEPAWPLSPRP